MLTARLFKTMNRARGSPEGGILQKQGCLELYNYERVC